MVWRFPGCNARDLQTHFHPHAPGASSARGNSRCHDRIWFHRRWHRKRCEFNCREVAPWEDVRSNTVFMCVVSCFPAINYYVSLAVYTRVPILFLNVFGWNNLTVVNEHCLPRAWAFVSSRWFHCAVSVLIFLMNSIWHFMPDVIWPNITSHT